MFEKYTFYLALSSVEPEGDTIPNRKSVTWKTGQSEPVKIHLGVEKCYSPSALVA